MSRCLPKSAGARTASAADRLLAGEDWERMSRVRALCWRRWLMSLDHRGVLP